MPPFLIGFLAVLIGVGTLFLCFAPIFIAACLEDNPKVPDRFLRGWIVFSVQVIWWAVLVGLYFQFAASHGLLR